jgi:hypothetical protein
LLGRSLLPFGCRHEFSDVAQHLVSRLRLPGGPLEDRVALLQAPRRERAGQPVEPLVHLVGGQFLELDRADERYHVPFGEDAVGRDGVRVAILEPPGEPVADRVPHGVGVAGIDAGRKGVNGLPQLVRDGRFGPAPALRCACGCPGRRSRG